MVSGPHDTRDNRQTTGRIGSKLLTRTESKRSFITKIRKYENTKLTIELLESMPPPVQSSTITARYICLSTITGSTAGSARVPWPSTTKPVYLSAAVTGGETESLPDKISSPLDSVIDGVNPLDLFGKNQSGNPTEHIHLILLTFLDYIV